MHFQILGPQTFELLGQSITTERRAKDRAELRTAAAELAGRLDTWLAAGDSRPSRCGQCLAPIATTALGCNSCGVDYLADVRHTPQAVHHGLTIEHSPHHGAIIAIR